MFTRKIFLFVALAFLVLSLTGLILDTKETGRMLETSKERETTTSTASIHESATTSTTQEKTTTLETTTTTEETTSTTSTTILPGDPLCEELGCPYGTKFVGSKNSDLYHYCHCTWAKKIKPENLVCFFSKEEAEAEGYSQSSCEETTTTSTSTTTTFTTTETTSSSTTSSDTTVSSSTTTTSTQTTSTTFSSTTTILESDDCINLGCPEDTKFVGSKYSDKYHFCNCTWAKKIKPENLNCFSSKEEALANGYLPCKVCDPPE